MNKKSIVISSGDPAGCGPHVTLEAVKKFQKQNIDFFLAGDKLIFERIAAYKDVKNNVNFINLKTPGIEKIQKGCPSKLTGAAALSYLNAALKIMKEKGVNRLVTAPLSKEAVKFTQEGFCGHTEYLAACFKVNNFAMMMASKSLNVILLSRHIPLRDVAFSINKKIVHDALSLAYSALKKQFKIKNPKIVFVSVNPHAGLDTFLDSEEKKIVEAIREFKAKVYGPYPCDTIFAKEKLKNYDCIICAYHDQGMIPFKILSFYDGVNVTLGLPIIRTSPAHGTAFDLMKTGKKPSSLSMEAAIKMALKLSA